MHVYSNSVARRLSHMSKLNRSHTLIAQYDSLIFIFKIRQSARSVTPHWLIGLDNRPHPPGIQIHVEHADAQPVRQGHVPALCAGVVGVCEWVSECPSVWVSVCLFVHVCKFTLMCAYVCMNMHSCVDIWSFIYTYIIIWYVLSSEGAVCERQPCAFVFLSTGVR